MGLYTFKCGCSFPILGPSPLPKASHPLIDIDIQNLNENCPETWRLFAKGQTVGVFQLEGFSGESWSKTLKPATIEHIAALTAILRPGCTQAKDDKGVSMTEHFCRRKNLEEVTESLHPSIDQCVSDTYNIMIYQEQALRTAQVLAGFDLKQIDILRKAIGKKDTELMAQVKKMFIEGAEKQGIVSATKAEEIFGIIQKSQRYSFNKSHGVTYGIHAFVTAYFKAHTPVEFFTSYLFNANLKQKPFEEVAKLVNDAKSMSIYIGNPCLLEPKKNFFTDGQDIFFGLGNIKGVGEATIEHIKNIKITEETTWIEFMFEIAPTINSGVVKAFISAGTLDFLGLSRTQMLFEYEKIQQLTNLELDWFLKNYKDSDTVGELFNKAIPLRAAGGAATNTKSSAKITDLAKSINNPPFSMIDRPEWLASTEKEYLGVPLSATCLDACDLTQANSTCKDFIDGKGGKNLVIGATINRLKIVKIKNGNMIGAEMAFLEISDQSSILKDVTIFPENLKKYRELLFDGNTILVSGYKEKKRGSFVIQQVQQI